MFFFVFLQRCYAIQRRHVKLLASMFLIISTLQRLLFHRSRFYVKGRQQPFFIISMINGYHKSELIRFIYFFILI